MKTIFRVLLAVLCISAVACQKMKDNTKIEEDRYIPVSLGFAGEVTDIFTSPMSRGNEYKDWYQIQVYSSPIGESDYSYYGYGFFDNTENMIINLKEGYEYKFVADMIVDGEQSIHCFALVNSGWARIGNSFYLSFDEHIRYLGDGYIYMNKDIYNRPDVDRFFGITEGYVPSEKGKVSIKMKRVSFGAHFIPQNFPDGKIEIAIDQAPTTIIDATEGTETDKITISFNNTWAAYMDDKYTEDIAVNVIWVKDDGMRVPVISQEFTFQRNHNTHIKFSLTNSAKTNTFGIVADEAWEEGEIIEVEKEGIDTEIKP
ncbi:MAG: hypothetical protein IKU36_05395 [Bacteroidales bacterium]|nr:hypothetical protein [Bacteroidales bacterium]